MLPTMIHEQCMCMDQAAVPAPDLLLLLEAAGIMVSKLWQHHLSQHTCQ
jgi:hypothetical protein